MSYILLNQTGKGCVAVAAFFIGMNADISAPWRQRPERAMISIKRDAEMLSFNRFANDGVTFAFINSTAPTHDWHFVHAIDQPVNLTVRRLPEGRIHARTQGFPLINCCENCPVGSSSLDTRSTKSNIEEVDLSWTEPKGYGTKMQSDVKEAASSAADFVVTQPAGT